MGEFRNKIEQKDIKRTACGRQWEIAEWKITELLINASVVL